MAGPRRSGGVGSIVHFWTLPPPGTGFRCGVSGQGSEPEADEPVAPDGVAARRGRGGERHRTGLGPPGPLIIAAPFPLPPIRSAFTTAIRRPPMSELLNIEPERVLAVFAHPDCAIVNCGGALALWAAGGAEVTVVSCSRGERGGADPDLSDAEMADRRRRELSESLSVLGALPPVILDYPDGELENTLALRRSVVGLIRTHRPDVLISHDPTAVFYGDRYISHPDHRAVGWAVVDSAGSPSASVRYHPDLGAPHRVRLLLLAGSLDPAVAVDIGSVVGAKVAAIKAQVSHVGTEADWVDEMVRARAEQSGEAFGVSLAELFRAVRSDGPAD